MINSNVEHFIRGCSKLLSDVELGRHDMFLHNCLLFHLVIALILILIVVIKIVIFQVVIIVASEVLLRRLNIVPLFIVLSTHRVKAIFIEIVAQWVVIAPICFKYIKSIVVIRTTAILFNFLRCVFLQQRTSSIFIDLLRILCSYIEPFLIVEASQTIITVFIELVAIRIEVTSSCQDIEAILVVLAILLLYFLLRNTNKLLLFVCLRWF